MLNEEKIKIMNKLAMYEQGEGKKYLPVSKYYRSDYIGLAMIKNFFLVTIGYCLVLAGIAAYFGEYLIDNIHKMNLVSVGVEAILGYVVVLIFFSVLTYIQYTVNPYCRCDPEPSDRRETSYCCESDRLPHQLVSALRGSGAHPNFDRYAQY